MANLSSFILQISFVKTHSIAEVSHPKSLACRMDSKTPREWCDENLRVYASTSYPARHTNTHTEQSITHAKTRPYTYNTPLAHPPPIPKKNPPTHLPPIHITNSTNTMKSLLIKQRQKLTKTLALFKKKRVPPASLETYPVDILNAIADKLSLKDFRSLRLVTKAISLATILLFTRKYLHYLKIDFTEEGLQRAIDITSHYDVSGTLCFGPRINTITFDLTHFVWKSEEEGVWLEAITRTRDPIHWRTLKKRSREAARQWRSHQKLIGGLYAQMLEAIFRQVEGVTVEIIGERRDNDYDYEGMVMFRSRGRFRRSGLNGYEPSEPEK